MNKSNRKLNVIYKKKTIEIDWTNSLNDLKDDCQRKFPYSDYEKRMAKIFIVLPNKETLEINDENEFKKLIQNPMIKTIIIKISQQRNDYNINHINKSINYINNNNNENINYINNNSNNNSNINDNINNNNENNYYINNNYNDNNNNNNNNENNNYDKINNINNDNNYYINNNNNDNNNNDNNNNDNINNINNLLEKIENLEKKYNDLINIFQKEKFENQNIINEQEKRIKKLENIIFNSNNRNKLQNDIITNPGLMGEILFDQKNIQFIPKIKIENDEPIKINIQIKNIGTIDITETCKIICEKEKENELNLMIKNPNINDSFKVIKTGITKSLTLELICLNKQNIKIGKHSMKIAIFSNSYGIISKWIRIYFFINDNNSDIYDSFE